LDNLSKWKTMITIAHRLQTIKKSDLIFVFENWKIIDKWNHKELLKKSKVYSKLVDLQSGKIG
jgi:ABC-type multidrug transport system fused ATPase/permease subunit